MSVFARGVWPRCCSDAVDDWISLLLGVRDDETLLACWLRADDIGAAFTETVLATGVGAMNENSGEFGAKDPSASSLGTASSDANVLSPSEVPIIASAEDSRCWVFE